MKHIALPDKLEYIGEYCFRESGLEFISLPPTLKIIGKNAFYLCENLRNVKFSENLEKIGMYAFFGSGLENAELPASLRTVSQAAFAKCKSLKTVKFSEGLEVLGTDELKDGELYYGVFHESSVEHVELPSTLKRIEYYAFGYCKNLKNIALPESLEYIGKYCFWKSRLQTIQIPKTGV